MKFGIFDHLDDAGVPLSEHFANRLKLAEAYDRSGFHAYHLAEHHGTPLGCAASPRFPIAGLGDVLAHQRVVVFGEIHGTREIPRVVGGPYEYGVPGARHAIMPGESVEVPTPEPTVVGSA